MRLSVILMVKAQQKFEGITRGLEKKKIWNFGPVNLVDCQNVQVVFQLVIKSTWLGAVIYFNYSTSWIGLNDYLFWWVEWLYLHFHAYIVTYRCTNKQQKKGISLPSLLDYNLLLWNITVLCQPLLTISKYQPFHITKITHEGTKLHDLVCKFCLPRPIEDAMPRAIHHNPNRKYWWSSWTCCRKSHYHVFVIFN